MRLHRERKLRLALHLFFAAACLTPAAYSAEVELKVRRQVRFGPLTPSIACYRGEESEVRLDARRTAVVIASWCRRCPTPDLGRRVDAMTPQLDRTLAAARKLGMLVVHLPAMDGNALPALAVETADRTAAGETELKELCRRAGIQDLIFAGPGSNTSLPAAVRAISAAGLRCWVLRDLTTAIAPVDSDASVAFQRPWETAAYVDAKAIRDIEHHAAPTFDSHQLLVLAGLAQPRQERRAPVKRVLSEQEVAAYQPAGASTRFRHLTLDWNWNGGYLDDYFLRADPVEIAEFVAKLNVDAVVIMSGSHHGYATFPSDNAPSFPAIAGRDFYGEVIRECHRRGIAVIGYQTLARNWWYSAAHPGESWIRQGGSKVEPMIDLNGPYLEHLVALSQETLRKYSLDGFRYDTLQQDPEARTPWSLRRYLKLYGARMPAAWDESNWRRKLDFQRSATSRAARLLYEGNKSVKPAIEVWQNGFIQHKDFDINDLEAGRYQDIAYIEAGDPFRQLLLSGTLRLHGTIVGGLFNMPRPAQRLCMALGARGYQFKAVNSETLLPDNRQWFFDNIAPFYAMVKNIQPYLEDARPVPYAGVVYSEATRYRAPGYDRDWYVYGILKPLAMSYLEHSKVVEFLLSLDLPKLDFSHLSVIVLPETAGLKPAELDGLRRYVRSGGQLLVTGEALRYSETGAALSDFALAREMGLSYRGTTQANWAWRHAALGGGRTTLAVQQPGPASLRLWMRKSKARIDQIVLARDVGYHPQGKAGAGESSRVVVVEAEAFRESIPRRNRVWRVRRDVPGYSGDGSIRAELDRPTLVAGAVLDETPSETVELPAQSPEAVYDVSLPAAGDYYVWVRQSHDGPQDDSVWIGLDAQPAIAMDFSDHSHTRGGSGEVRPEPGTSGPRIEMARSAGFRNLVEYEPVDGETLARVMVDGQAKPLAHARQEGKGRIVYLATSEDIGLVRSVVDAMAGAAPAAPTPAGSQVVLTRQPQKKRWVLHLLADGDYTIDIDSRFATPAGVAERYPQAGWSASVEKTAKGIRIRVSGGASDRLLALE